MTVALIAGAVVVNVAVWDGLSVWRPIALGLCDTTANITGLPVSAGSTWNPSTLTFTDPVTESTVTIASSAVDITQ